MRKLWKIITYLYFFPTLSCERRSWILSERTLKSRNVTLIKATAVIVPAARSVSGENLWAHTFSTNLGSKKYVIARCSLVGGRGGPYKFLSHSTVSTCLRSLKACVGNHIVLKPILSYGIHVFFITLSCQRRSWILNTRRLKNQENHVT